ncbi:MAG: hybrid sensor histidine kinase/response regulator [Bacteroidetes bacterium]|nr:hybrid sensor histidine kinase/response regulator [Bacteroidota bacterium]
MRNISLLTQNIPNILIVDDIPDNLQILGGILDANGYRVREVPTGMLALQVAEKEKPDLILLDIMMPDMNGFEVCRLFKKNKNLNDVPIIFISALNDTNDIVTALKAGGVDYITKPFRHEEVRARVATHINLYRQRKELQLQSIELQKLNAEKDKFFTIIAHDLKSPFNSIVGFSNLLVEQVREKDYEGIEKYAGIILKSSDRALELLKNLMEWARSQTGRIEFNPEYFEMVVVINEIILSFDDIAGQKSIIINKALPPNAPVFADKAMISVVLRNLISNAIKFTMTGGTITISAQEKQGELTVTVSDTGVGISNDRIEKLFRIDESYSTAGTNNERGTGMGLILCKEFIETHGGKIWVESEKGKGSVFNFTVARSMQ